MNIDIYGKILLAIYLETAKKAYNMEKIIRYTEGGQDFISALYKLYNEGFIYDVEFVFDYNTLEPVEANWMIVKLTNKGKQRVRKILEMLKSFQ